MKESINIDFKEFEAFRRRILKKFSSHSPRAFWGDRIDSRFIASFIARRYKKEKILDLGCCTGMVLSELDRSNKKFGLELLRDNLVQAHKINEETRFVRADMLRLPFKDNSFDCVIAFAMVSIPAWDQKASFFYEMSRVLKRGGRLVLTTANREYLSRIDKTGCANYEQLKGYVEQDFDCRIYGFNPLPSFPYFLPNSIMAFIPGIWRFLVYLANNDVLVRHCRSFLVVGTKR